MFKRRVRVRVLRLPERRKETRKTSRFATALAVSFRRHHGSLRRSVVRPLVRPLLGRLDKAREMDLEYGLLDGLSDYRTFHPDWSSYSGSDGVSIPSFPVTRVPIRKTQYVVGVPRSEVVPAGRHAEYLRFALPSQVMICVRRRQRRQVLFALGKGGSGYRPPEWKEESHIRC